MNLHNKMEFGDGISGGMCDLKQKLDIPKGYSAVVGESIPARAAGTWKIRAGVHAAPEILMKKRAISLMDRQTLSGLGFQQ